MPENRDAVVAFAAWFDDTPRNHHALAAAARAHVEGAHPDDVEARHLAEKTREGTSTAWRELYEAEQGYSIALQHYGSIDSPAERLARENDAITTDTATLIGSRERIAALQREPTLRALPPETVELARADWNAERQHRASWLAVRASADREMSAVDLEGRRYGSVSEDLHEQPARGIGR